MSGYTPSPEDVAIVAKIIRLVGAEPGAWPDDAAHNALTVIGPAIYERGYEAAVRHLSVPAPHYRQYVDGNHCKACADYVARKDTDDDSW